MRFQPLVFQIAGHVHPDEHHLKAANKVTRHQQLKAAVAKGFAQGFADGLSALATKLLQGRLTQSKRQRQGQQ
jgi:hypothetical protein